MQLPLCEITLKQRVLQVAMLATIAFVLLVTIKWLSFPSGYEPILNLAYLKMLHNDNQIELNSSVSSRSVITSSFDASKRVRLITVEMEAGRLGNRLFQYASMYGIAKRFNFVAVVRYGSSLLQQINKTYLKAEILSDEAVRKTTWRAWRESRASSYNESEVKSGFQGSDNVLLEFYLQSYRYFEGYEADVVSQFVFSRAVRDWAAAYVRSVMARVPAMPNSTIVGVHVRRGDYVNNGDKTSGYNTPDMDYYFKTIQYFTKRYAFVTFIVCSTEVQWVTDLVKKLHANSSGLKSSTYFELFAGVENEPEKDMAVLSLTNHSVVSAGTYSFWSAMLRQYRLGSTDNGTTLYYNKPFRPNTFIAETYGNSVANFYPPSWIGFD